MKMKIVQCWDDGVTADIRLMDILRKYNAKASFNICAGNHDRKRKHSWNFKDTEVWALGLDEMPDAYSGFVIASHSLTHPRLEKIPIEKATRDIVHGRERLQKIFRQEVLGFAYPFGGYNEAVKDAIRKAGHLYARTCVMTDFPFPPKDPMEFHPNCHFLAPDFWGRYEKAKEKGVFYFWGHSYELITEEMWEAFDNQIQRIHDDPEVEWCNLPDLF